MSPLTTLRVQAEVEALPLPFGTEPQGAMAIWSWPCLRSCSMRDAPTHMASAGGTHSAQDAAASADLEVLLSLWQLHQGAQVRH